MKLRKDFPSKEYVANQTKFKNEVSEILLNNNDKYIVFEFSSQKKE